MRFTAINQKSSASEDVRSETIDADSGKHKQTAAPKTREALESEAFQKYNEALQLERSGEHDGALKILRDVINSDIVAAFLKKLQSVSDCAEWTASSTSHRTEAAADPAFSRLCYLVLKNIAFILIDRFDELRASQNLNEVGILSADSGTFANVSANESELIEEALGALNKALRIDDSDPICWLRMGKVSTQIGLPEFAYYAYRKVTECGDRFNMSANRLVIAELLKYSLAFYDVDRCFNTMRIALQNGAITNRKADELLQRSAFCIRTFIDCFAVTEEELEPLLKSIGQWILPQEVLSRFNGELQTIREQMRTRSPHSKPLNRMIELSSIKLPHSKAVLAETNAISQTTIIVNAIQKEHGDSWTIPVDVTRLFTFLERASSVAVASESGEKLTTDAKDAAACAATQQSVNAASNSTPNLQKAGSKRKWAAVDERYVEKRRSTRTTKAVEPTTEELPVEDEATSSANAGPSRSSRHKQTQSTSAASQEKEKENERFADRLIQFFDRQVIASFNERVAELRNSNELRSTSGSDTNKENTEGEAVPPAEKVPSCAESETNAFIAWCSGLRKSNAILLVELVESFLVDFLGRGSLQRVRIASCGIAHRAFIELVESYVTHLGNSLELDRFSHDLSTLSSFVNVLLVYADSWLQLSGSRGTSKAAVNQKDQEESACLFRRICDFTLLAIDRISATSPCVATMKQHRNAVLLIEAESNLIKSRAADAEIDAQRRAAEASRFLFDCLREAASGDEQDPYFGSRARERLAEMTVHTLLLSALRPLEIDVEDDRLAQTEELRSFVSTYAGCDDSRPAVPTGSVASLAHIALQSLHSADDANTSFTSANDSFKQTVVIENDLATLFVLEAVGGVLQRNAALTRVTAERFEKVLLGIVERANVRLSELTAASALRCRYNSVICKWLRLAVEHLFATVSTNISLQQNLLALITALLRTYPIASPADTTGWSLPSCLADYAALFVSFCLRSADSASLGKVYRRTANNRRLWLAFCMASSPICNPRLLSLVHDYLGHAGDCRANEFEVPKLVVRQLLRRVPEMDADAHADLQQAFACLFGTDICAAFGEYSSHSKLPDCDAHRCSDADAPETYAAADYDLLFGFIEFFRFAELPEYDSYKSLSATDEMEQFIRRVLRCVPAPLVQYAQQLTDRLFEQLLAHAADNDPIEFGTSSTRVNWSVQDWIAGAMAAEQPPDVEGCLSKVDFELVTELQFLIGDYLFKNTQFSEALPFLRNAVCWCAMAQARSSKSSSVESESKKQRLAFIRFNAWALLALAQQGLIDAMLAETAASAAAVSKSPGVVKSVTLVRVPMTDLVYTRLAFEQALSCCADAAPDDAAKRNEDRLKLAAEHAAFLYVVHSYAERTLKLTVGAPADAQLVALSHEMLRRAGHALADLLNFCDAIAKEESDALMDVEPDGNDADSGNRAAETTPKTAHEVPTVSGVNEADAERERESENDSDSSSCSSDNSSEDSKPGKRQAHTENELWLAHYLLGKCAEKARCDPQQDCLADDRIDARQLAPAKLRSPIELAVVHYMTAIRQLEHLSPKHPKAIKRTFAVPPRFSVETIEIFYRVTRLVLDRLVNLLRLAPRTRDHGDVADELQYLEETLRDLRNSGFVKAHAHTVHEVDSSELVALGFLLRPTAVPCANLPSDKTECQVVVDEVCDVVSTLADLTDFAGRIGPILECVTNLELCVSRFPKYFKAHVRLARYFTMLADSLRERAQTVVRGASQLRAHADTLVAHAAQHLLGVRVDEPGSSLFAARAKSSGAKANALLSERRPNNLFNGVWMLPIQDLDRPGSFICALYRAGCLLIDVLYRSRSLSAIDEVFTVLSAAAQSDSQRAERTYLRDFELHCLVIRAVHRFTSLALELRRSSRLDRDALESVLVRLCVMLPVFEASCAQIGCTKVPESGASTGDCAFPISRNRAVFIDSLKHLVRSIYMLLRVESTSTSMTEEDLWQRAVVYARSCRVTTSKSAAVRRQNSAVTK